MPTLGRRGGLIGRLVYMGHFTNCESGDAAARKQAWRGGAHLPQHRTARTRGVHHLGGDCYISRSIEDHAPALSAHLKDRSRALVQCVRAERLAVQGIPHPPPTYVAHASTALT